MTESNQKQPEISIKQFFWSVINFVQMLFAVFFAANDDIHRVIKFVLMLFSELSTFFLMLFGM